MSDVTKKTIDRLKKFSDALDDMGLNTCSSCGWLLPVVLVGLSLYCKPCAEKIKPKDS